MTTAENGLDTLPFPANKNIDQSFEEIIANLKEIREFCIINSEFNFKDKVDEILHISKGMISMKHKEEETIVQTLLSSLVEDLSAIIELSEILGTPCMDVIKNFTPTKQNETQFSINILASNESSEIINALPFEYQDIVQNLLQRYGISNEFRNFAKKYKEYPANI